MQKLIIFLNLLIKVNFSNDEWKLIHQMLTIEIYWLNSDYIWFTKEYQRCAVDENFAFRKKSAMVPIFEETASPLVAKTDLCVATFLIDCCQLLEHYWSLGLPRIARFGPVQN